MSRCTMLSLLFLVSVRLFAPTPLESKPRIAYRLRVNSSDLSGFDVEMRVANVPDTFRVAMYAHFEYDDKYWRFVEGLTCEAAGRQGSIVREDSALWRVIAPGGSALLRYRLHLPQPDGRDRAAYRPFLTPSGGLVGGPHSFMYVVGLTHAPARIDLELPPGWNVATGLERGREPFSFGAPNARVLLDSPFLVGILKTWEFSVDAVPHRVAYWPLPNAAPFDTSALLNHIRRIVSETAALFGHLPYKDYSFLLQDGAFGALEHLNSVTIGAPSRSLSENPGSILGIVSHEYFHTWNLVKIRPAEYGDVDYHQPPPTKGLWWSEGVTMFYSDLLLRRSGLPASDSTRIRHLETMIGRFIGSAGSSHISPERVSLVSNGPPGQLGDSSASTHLQGELLGAMLDLVIRDASGDKKSLDDVLRLVFQRFGGDKGFTNPDIEQALSDVCGCDVHAFFADHVYGNRPIDFDRYLALMGLRTRVEWKEAMGENGQASPDLRAYAWQAVDGGGVRLGITDPASSWGKAGLHTGDEIVTFRDTAVENPSQFRRMLGFIKLGDTVSIEVRRPSGSRKMWVSITGYTRPQVTIEQVAGATDRQLALRDRWLAGKP